MFKFASKEIASKYTIFWDSPIYNIMFTCYKRCDRDGKVKDASKEDERDVSVHPRMIYFFSYFAIHSPCVGEKLGDSPFGYGVGVILPVDQLESFMTKDGVTTMSFTVNGSRAYGTFELRKELYSELPRADELYIDPLVAITKPKSQLFMTMAAHLDPNMLPKLQTYEEFHLNPQMYNGVKTVWVSQLHDFPQTDQGLTSGQERVLARVIIRPPEFETFNEHVITDYKIGRNGLLIMGDFLIPKQYCLTLDGAEAAHRRYELYKANFNKN